MEEATRQFLSFRIGDSDVGIPLLEVRQIIAHVPPTRVPQLPEVVRGVINVRGTIVPVVDLGLRFGLPVRDATARSCIVIVEAPEVGALGIVADLVHDVVDLRDQDVLPTPEFGTQAPREDLIGLASVQGGILLLLDTARVLSPAVLLAVTFQIAKEQPSC